MKNLILTFLLTSSYGAFGKEIHMAVTQVVEHEALNLLKNNALEVVKASFKDIKINAYNGQGNPVLISQIGKTILDSRPDIILAIGTSSAQSVVMRNTFSPVVFTGISDPVGAKLVKSLTHPAGIATGMTDQIDLETTFLFLKEMVPSLKKLGTVYNPGESNSVSSVKKLKEFLKKKDIILVEKPVSNSLDVKLAFSQMSQVDAVYITTDNTVASSLAIAVSEMKKLKKPFLSSFQEAVEKGALASNGINYKDMGVETGKMIVKILQGKSQPNSTPVESLKSVNIQFNQKTADEIGFRLPASLKQKTTII